MNVSRIIENRVYKTQSFENKQRKVFHNPKDEINFSARIKGMKELEEIVEKHKLEETIIFNFKKFLDYLKENEKEWVKAFFGATNPDSLKVCKGSYKKTNIPQIIQIEILLKENNKDFAKYCEWYDFSGTRVDNWLEK